MNNMKWLLEKYEWLFFLLHRSFKRVYSERADPAMYAFGVLNLPIFILIAIIIIKFLPNLERTYIMVFGGIIFVLFISIYFSDRRISEIERRYEGNKKENSKEK